MSAAAPLHVACTADGSYLPFCLTMLRSLFRHAPGRAVVVHFLATPDIAPANRAAVERYVRSRGHGIRVHVIPDEDVADLPPMRTVRRVVWYRLFLPRLLPDVERVLYLDADVLIVDRIDPLADVDLRGHPLAAVPNVIEPATRRGLLPALGLPADARYFNSGVMVMDLRAMRAARCAERVLAYARANAATLLWGDQDALNAVLARDYLPLHPRWNCMNSLFYFSHAREVFDPATIVEARREPAVLHFEGPDDVKPWNVASTHPWRDIYLRELRAATWALPLPLSTRLGRAAWYALPLAARRAVARLRGRTVVPAPVPLT